MSNPIDSISQHFSSVVPLDNEGKIYLADYAPKGNLMGRYFLDFSKPDLRTAGDLEQYLEQFNQKYVSDAYYEIPGAIQWNYYWLLVDGHFSPISEERFIRDSTYTRKYALKNEELEDFFSYTTIPAGVENEMTSQWKSRLREEKLDVVLSELSFSQIIDHIRDGLEFNFTEPETSNDEGFIPEIINNFSSIRLSKDFRLHPGEFEMDFGQVNLVSGPNGAGKTSFLEAIELAVCGRSRRNPKDRPVGIELKYGEDVPFRVLTDKENHLYRLRSQRWYNALSIETGNTIQYSFSRYNFFDADAAYRLGNPGKGKYDKLDLSSELQRMVFGDEFDKIKSRFEKIIDKLKPLDNKITVEIEAHEKKISDAKFQIGNIQQSDKKPVDLFRNWINECKKHGWKGNLPSDPNENPLEFDNDKVKIQLAIKVIRSYQVEWGGDLASVSKEINDLGSLVSAIEEKEAEIQKSNLEGKSLSKDITTLQTEIENLGMLFKLVKEQDFETFKGIADLQVDLRKQMIRLEYLEEDFLLIDWENLPAGSTVAVLSDELDEKISDKTVSIQKRKKAISELEINLKKVDKLINEIKVKGLEYLNLSGDDSACPLCESPFASGELLTKVENLKSSLSDSSAINLLAEELALLNSQLVEIEGQKESINRIMEIRDAGFFINNDIESTIDEIFEILEGYQQSGIETKQKIRDNELIEKRFNKLGFDESSFSLMKSFAEKMFPERELEENLSEEIEQRIEKNQKSISAYSNQIANFDSHCNGLQNEIKKLLESKGFDPTTERKDIRAKIEKAKSAQQEIGTLTYFLPVINSDLEIRSAISHAELIIALYDSYLEANGRWKQNESALSGYKKTIISSQEKLHVDLPKAGRIRGAIDILNELLDPESRQKVLQNFFEKNFQFFKEAFLKIHAPDEFEDIRLGEEDADALLLKRKTTKEWEPLTKLSTGQRSAVALAIFLTLNRQLNNGPNIILLDDPVAYIDDLNILSFFDFLRELAIRENRQIFFATANRKISGLFRQKFSFLGDGFSFREISRL
jgi:DNA repair exonuclease SbcCD ATPase subunit